MNDIKKILTDNDLDRNADKWLDVIASVSADDVKRHLAGHPGQFTLERLCAFISPAAADHLEQMALIASDLTVQRFGKTIQLYAPLYVSNYCVNSCLYCGYNCTSKFDRTRLTIDQACDDAKIIADEGFRHILLVSGEDITKISPDYLYELAVKLRQTFSSVSIEIYPMETDQYQRCFAGGIDGITLYQETYNRDVYKKYHVAGPKSDYDYRLQTHDRAATAGMRRLGIGFLLGLADWRLETLALAAHGAYLMRKYWKSQISFSFPRLRPALGVCDDFDHLVSDSQMVQMMLALRLCFADAGLVLSTRESAALRDNLIKLCITRISAGSKTNPGGYSTDTQSTEQFSIDDSRNAHEVAQMIQQSGMEAVWKDWDANFTA